MATAAVHHVIDPDRISFTRSLRAAWRSIRAWVGTTNTAIDTALRSVINEITRERLPPRRLRPAARVVKRTMSNYLLSAPRTAPGPNPPFPSATASISSLHPN